MVNRMSGKRSGFSRFPLLAVGQGESQQPTDSSRFNSRRNDVDPSNDGGVGKNKGRLVPAFSLIAGAGCEHLRFAPSPFPLSSLPPCHPERSRGTCVSLSPQRLLRWKLPPLSSRLIVGCKRNIPLNAPISRLAITPAAPRRKGSRAVYGRGRRRTLPCF
jgi:hypothetical protein